MDPPPPSHKEHRRRGHDFGQVQGMNSQNENPNKAFHPYGAQSAPRVNADVGSGNILATARTTDPPPLINKGHEPRGNDLEERSQEQPMKMGSNKAFHLTRHKWRDGER